MPPSPNHAPLETFRDQLASAEELLAGDLTVDRRKTLELEAARLRKIVSPAPWIGPYAEEARMGVEQNGWRGD